MSELLPEDFELSSDTMAVLSNIDGSNLKAAVLEEQREYIVNLTPTKFIDHACKYFGCSLDGRLIGTRTVSNITHKAPITIDPMSGLYFFPTTSPKNKKCSWISHSHIKNYAAVQLNKTKITFNNGMSIIVEVSYGSIRNQIERTAQYRYILEQRLHTFRNLDEK